MSLSESTPNARVDGIEVAGDSELFGMNHLAKKGNAGFVRLARSDVVVPLGGAPELKVQVLRAAGADDLEGVCSVSGLVE